MTCVVAIAHDGDVWMGSDSAAVGNGYDLQLRKDRKMFRNGPFLIGFTTSFRMGQLLGVKFVPPDCPYDVDPWTFMVDQFVEQARGVLLSGGFSKKENNVESAGSWIVGFRGRLFEIDSDFQVAEPEAQFAAIGCGFAYGLGSLAETSDSDPRTRVYRALKAAEQFSAGVRGPFVIQHLPEIAA